MRKVLFTVAVVIVTLLAAERTVADTIVLKNGRRISALSVVDEGDKVRYQTAAGELTLPKAIVDHIEKGDAPAANQSDSSAGKLTIAPPAAEIAPDQHEAEIGAVHDGAVDREYLSNVASAARSGTSVASERAAMAYHAAALFEIARGDFQRAQGDEQTALSYAPENLILLLNLSYIHLRQSEFKRSLDYLERARRLSPQNADEAKLEGWAYYGMNKLERAVEEWTRALALRPDAEVQAALIKAKRDLEEEQNYSENESVHFTLRYSGAAAPELAHEVLLTLEAHFTAIEAALNYTPPEPIAVILYTGQDFADITRAPAWVGALNDGRIRVPVQGLTELTPDLSRVLKHELTHSFIQQMTRGRAPVWVQEGVAQWMEGKRSGSDATFLIGVYDAKQTIGLSDLEHSWMKMSNGTAAYAYAWSLANIEYVIQVDGMVDLQRILNLLANGRPTEEAVHDILHSNYDDLMKDTVDYLRSTYVH